MALRVANAVFAYVMDYITIIDNEYFAHQVAHALETRILSIINWDFIPKVELIDEIMTLVRRQPQAVRGVVAHTLDMAFVSVCRIPAIFTLLLDRSVGPEFLYGMDECQPEPQGPAGDVRVLFRFQA